MINIPLLSEICSIPGAPGYEQKIRSYLIDKASKLADEVKTDAMGNVIAIIKGSAGAKKIMVAAHMDEIAYMVTHIDDDGFIRFHTLGGFDPKTLTAQRVIIHGLEDVKGVMGSKPIHQMTADERTKAPKISDYFIDTGLSKGEVEALIGVGDPITRASSLEQLGQCVSSRSLDNRVSVYILLQILEKLAANRPTYDLYSVFTVQEEVGIRGSITASSGINPDFGIALDVTAACDTPGMVPHEFVTSLGKGTAIKVMDAGTICDYRMVNFLKETAKKQQIPYQMEILTGGGTDTAGIQRSAPGGAIAGAISIPTRYLHQVIETCHTDDIQSTIDLLAAAIGGLDQYDWNFK